MKDDVSDLKRMIRSIPGFPRPGILFRDITTLLKEPGGLGRAVEALVAPWRERGIDKVVCIESRGFLLGAPAALALNAGVVPARKPGKLPAPTLREEYALEYGTDALEIHRDAILPGERVLVVDDLLATGGTAAAVIRLTQRLQGEVVGCAFLVELAFLAGRSQLGQIPITSLVVYREEE